MPDPIVDGWIYATMLIENQWGEKGSGFLVSRELPGNDRRIYLVTNKHVLNSSPEKRILAHQVLLYANVTSPGGALHAETLEVPLRSARGARYWREHPDADTDVLVFDVTETFIDYPRLRHKWMNYDDFFTPEEMEEHDIRIGDEVFIVGYPLGLRHRTTNLPLLRSGIIATFIGTSLEDRVPDGEGGTRSRVLRAFLIDGGAIPGSSGSPVVLRPLPDRFVHGAATEERPPAYLLGILSEARYMPIEFHEQKIPSYSGLGLALDVDTVRETIDLFTRTPPVEAAY